MTTTTSATDWHAWIAENLVRGVSARDLTDTMVGHGVDRESAQRSVAAAADHPYVRGALAAAQRIVEERAEALGQTGGDARAKKYAWFLEVSRRAARQSTNHGEVARVTNPSSEQFLDEFYARNRPCVIEGAMAGWPAIERWTSPDYLKAKVGEAVVEVQSRGAAHDVDLSDPRLSKELPFSEFVDVCESGIEGNDWYMVANNGEKNRDSLLPLLDDIRLPDWLVPDPSQTFLWYGPTGIITPLHHDLTNNLMAQVRGRKAVRLIAPYESAHAYNHVHRYSQVDAFDIDLEAFPAMRDVTVLDVTIGPGEMLFVPVGWWHAVRGLDVSMTFTFMHFTFDNDFHSFYDSYGEL